MTDLDDAVRAVHTVADYYLNEMKEALDTADQAEVFEQGLKSGGVVYVRIHRLIPEVRQALTQLIDSDAELPKKGWIIDEVPEKGWVEWVLSVVRLLCCHLSVSVSDCESVCIRICFFVLLCICVYPYLSLCLTVYL